MDTKQAKFVWADATKFLWILIPAGAPNWESNVLPAAPPPLPLASSGAPDYYVLARVPVSTQSKITFSNVKSDTQGLCRRALVRFSRIKSEQSKMKNRRLLSFHTKPAIPIFFGGVSVPVLCFKRFLSVPDSSHWTLCILRRAHSSLPLPVCAHLCLFTKQVFTFQKFKTFSQKENKPSFLTLSLKKKNKGKKVSLRIISVAREVTGVKSREEFAPERRVREVSTHPERCRIFFVLKFFLTQSLLQGPGVAFGRLFHWSLLRTYWQCCFPCLVVCCIRHSCRLVIVMCPWKKKKEVPECTMNMII